MKVKRYKANSLEKIREVILKELGPQAVIINIRKQKNEKKGLMGLAGHQEIFEVTAAVEDAVEAEKALQSVPLVNFEEVLKNQKEQYRAIRHSIKMVNDKLAEIDEWMESVKTLKPTAPELEELCNIHDEWRPLITQKARDIAGKLSPRKEDWHEALASCIPTAAGIMFRRTTGSPPDTYVFIGPTGVGKTTTLAKLAARCVLTEKLNVGMITLDTFRVAAVDQLREYASLLGLELLVAFTNKELQQCIDKFYDKDIIFIDTPGRSQFDKLGIKNINECIDNVTGITILLVVPAGVRKEESKAIYENFGKLNPSALIISKSDEAIVCDGLTLLFDISNLPVIYITDGQRVPEDIHPASPGIVASLIMPSVKISEAVRIGES